MGINDDIFFRASHPRIAGAVYSRVFQGMIDQAHIRKPHFLARPVVVQWALKSQLQIPLPHADNAESVRERKNLSEFLEKRAIVLQTAVEASDVFSLSARVRRGVICCIFCPAAATFPP